MRSGQYLYKLRLLGEGEGCGAPCSFTSHVAAQQLSATAPNYSRCRIGVDKPPLQVSAKPIELKSEREIGAEAQTRTVGLREIEGIEVV